MNDKDKKVTDTTTSQTMPQLEITEEQWSNMEQLLNSGELNGEIHPAVPEVGAISVNGAESEDTAESTTSWGATLQSQVESIDSSEAKESIVEDLSDIASMLAEADAETVKLCDDLLRELKTRIQYRLISEENIRKSREISTRFSNRNHLNNTEIEKETRDYKVYPEKIKWIDDESEIEIQRFESPDGKVFWFGDISGLTGKTEIPEKLLNKKQKEEAVDTIIEHIGLKLDSTDKRHRNLRVFEHDDKIKKRTTLNPYKEDDIIPSGYDANQLRALILEDATAGDEPVYLLGTICHHDDQQRKIYNI